MNVWRRVCPWFGRLYSWTIHYWIFYEPRTWVTSLGWTDHYFTPKSSIQYNETHGTISTSSYTGSSFPWNSNCTIHVIQSTSYPFWSQHDSSIWSNLHEKLYSNMPFVNGDMGKRMYSLYMIYDVCLPYFIGEFLLDYKQVSFVAFLGWGCVLM